jgi:hypothetical protein
MRRYVFFVWLRRSRITNAWRQEDAQGMVTRSNFCTAAYAKARHIQAPKP